MITDLVRRQTPIHCRSGMGKLTYDGILLRPYVYLRGCIILFCQKVRIVFNKKNQSSILSINIKVMMNFNKNLYIINIKGITYDAPVIFLLLIF